jgi:hypothetical protein
MRKCLGSLLGRLAKWSPLREPLVLVQELPFFDDSIKLDPLFLRALDLCFHNMIIRYMLYEVGVELSWCQLFFYF